MTTCSDKSAVSSLLSHRDYNVQAKDPLGIPQFFSFNTATVWDIPTMTCIQGMHENHVEY